MGVTCSFCGAPTEWGRFESERLARLERELADCHAELENLRQHVADYREHQRDHRMLEGA